MGSGAMLLRFALVPVRANLLNATFQDCQRAHSGRKRLLCWLNAALAIDVATAYFNRIDSQHLSQSRHHNFSRELRLGCAEATKCPTGDVIGINGITISMDISNFIAASREKCGSFDDL